MFLYGNVCEVLGRLFPNSGFIQLSQELIFLSPTYTEEKLLIEIKITNILAPKRIYKLETVIIRPNGELGLQGTTIVQELSPEIKPEWNSNKSFPSKYDKKFKDSFKGLRLGQSDTLSETITQNDLKKYVDLLKDSNKIYSNLKYTKSLGFNNLLIPNPLICGIISQQLGTRLPGEGTNWLKLKMDFRKPICINEEIQSVVEITKIRPEKDLVNLNSYLYNSSKGLIAKGEILVLVKDLIISND